MKVKNQPVGTVECPQKGCAESCKVYRFRPRAEGRRTVFSGKHYCECPKHGRIGADGNPTINEYILCNAKMDAPATAAASPKIRAPATTPAPSPSASTGSPGAPASSSTPAAPTRSPWRTLIDLE